MHKLDLEPFSPMLIRNKEAHIDYLKYTHEHANSLYEIVEHARDLRPLNSDLDSACKSATRVQELLVYVRDTCPSSTRQREKLIAVTPINRFKKVRFAEPSTLSSYTHKQIDSCKTKDYNNPLFPSTGVISSTSASGSKPQGNTKKNRISRPTSSNKKNKVYDHLWRVKPSLNKTNCVSEPVCNENVAHSILNANSELICATCNECMFDSIHDLCVLDYLNDVNVHAKPKSVKSKKKKMWKPTGQVYTNVGYSWKPTGWTFTIDGNTFPLTMITSTTVLPPKKPISTILVKKIAPSSNTSGKLKDIINLGSSNKSKNIASKICNNSEPNKNWGSNVSTALSFSRVHFKSFKSSYGVDLLKGSRGSNLYTISLEEMMQSSPICLLSKATKTKSWLWNRRLSHLNFGYINEISKQGLVRGLPKLKFQKDHLFSACALGKRKKHTHKPKFDDSIQEKLYLLHMDMCGPMRIKSVNGEKYILVIIDDYLRFTWVKFLRSKDETQEIVIKLLMKIQVCLNATVCNIRIDNGTEFMDQTLQAYYDDVGISHQTSVARTPQPNGIVERQNCNLVEVSCTIRHNKTPYELIHDRKPYLTYFHVFGALCYPTNDGEDQDNLKPKADIGILVGYTPTKKAYRIYNRRTRMIMETIHVEFDELTAMTSEQFGSGPELQLMTPEIISSGLVQNPPSPIPYVPPTKNDWDLLFQPMFDEYFNPPPNVVFPVLAGAAPRPADPISSPSSTSIDQNAPSTGTSSTIHETQSLFIYEGVEEQLQQAPFDDDPFLDILASEPILKNHCQLCNQITYLLIISANG
ncbi:retrovirus-related pol polyprotein from transposon TNT 1-94 [Tanacetum coccineum]